MENPMTMTVEQYVNHVLTLLTGNPTASDIDELVEAYATIGWYAQEAEREYELKELTRKIAQADATVRVKMNDPKATANIVEAQVMIDTRELQSAEVSARANARKLKGLQESIEQTINAIKFLGRNDGVRIGRG
jgi:hypothetical protein